jgi:thiol-disulfide isomerase/thioredoxin
MRHFVIPTHLKTVLIRGIACCALFLAGCAARTDVTEAGSVDPPVAKTAPPAPSQNESPETATAAPHVPLAILDWDQVQERIRAQSGQLVVLDVWMTTCQPCKDEFPKFVAFANKYADRGVACMSIDLDYDGIEGKPPEYFRERVQKFLDGQRAEFENVVLAVPCIDFLNLMDLHSSPTFLIYSTDGKLLEKLDGDSVAGGQEALTMEYVASVVDRHLSQLSSNR